MRQRRTGRRQSVDMRAVWNRMARPYQAHYRIPTDQIHYGPNVPSEDELQLLGDPRGRDVLEVGCGGGQNAVAFKKRGAARVVGIDISDSQIAHARSLAKQENADVQFYRGTAERLHRFSDASFDIAISAYCLSYVADLARSLREVYRVLRPHGRFALSLDHPIVGMTGDDGVTFERSYFQREAAWLWTLPGGARARVRAYYRTVEEIFDALRAPGFTVERIIEPPHRPLPESRWDEPMYTQTTFPATIIFAARKSGGSPADRTKSHKEGTSARL